MCLARSEFESVAEAVRHYQDVCRSLEDDVKEAHSEMEDYTESSKELQHELETELERMDKSEKEIRSALERAEADKDEWKVSLAQASVVYWPRISLEVWLPNVCVADCVFACSQSKYSSSLREHTTTMTHMQRELESLRAAEKSLRGKLRDMELDNDDLEKSER